MALPLSHGPSAQQPTRPRRPDQDEDALVLAFPGLDQDATQQLEQPLAPLPWELLFGAEVRGRDAAAGRLEGVVVCPATWQAEHLVLRRDASRGEAAVPVDLLLPVAGDGVQLDVDQDGLERLPALRPLPDRVRIDRGTTVFGDDGAFGRVRGLVLSPTAREVDDLIMRTGRFLGRDVRAPRAWSRDLRAGRIQLAANRPQLERLPRFRPGRALAAAVYRALRTAEPLRRLDLPHMRVRASGGVVELTGYVRYGQGGQLAAELARGVAGVTAVRNRLVADEDLVGLVATAVAEEAQNDGAAARVAVHAGTAVLEGDAPSEAARDAVVAAARRVPGVREVWDRLVVRPTAGRERWSAKTRREHGLLPNDRLLRRVDRPML